MRRRRALSERARAAGSVFLWEAAVVVATVGVETADAPAGSK